MRITIIQFAEAYARLEPGIEIAVVRAHYAAIATQDGDASMLTERDFELVTKAAKSSPFLGVAQKQINIVRSVVDFAEAERAAIAVRVREGPIQSLLSVAAGQVNRLRLLDRAELRHVAERIRLEAPRDGFRLASILGDAIVSAARDPRLDAEQKERIISDSCEALLCLSADDVAFAFNRYEPRALALLLPHDRARVAALLATIPSSMFDKQ